RSAVAGQKRRVHVDKSETWRVKDRLIQNFAVGGHHADVGVKAGKGGHEARLLEALGLEDRHGRRSCEALDGPFRHPLAAATRAIWLAHDADERVRRRQQGLERGYRKSRRAEEDNAKGLCGYHFPARASFLIFRTIRSRLMPRSRSTKRVPSR